MQALGFIETRSLTASIEASDVMTKTADVWVVGTEKIGSGLVNVVIQGDVDAVTAAVKAGEAVAKEIGKNISRLKNFAPVAPYVERIMKEGRCR